MYIWCIYICVMAAHRCIYGYKGVYRGYIPGVILCQHMILRRTLYINTACACLQRLAQCMLRASLDRTKPSILSFTAVSRMVSSVAALMAVVIRRIKSSTDCDAYLKQVYESGNRCITGVRQR